MTRPSRRRPDLRGGAPAAPAAVALALLLGAAALLLPGCDNPACLFSADGCGDGTAGGGTGALGEMAIEPLDGELVRSGAPSVVRAEPSDTDVHSSSPAVLVFSETMNPDTVLTAFAVVNAGTGFPTPSSASLVGDGRVLVIFPDSPLTPGEYRVERIDGATPSDLTGQGLSGADAPFNTFTVPGTDPTSAESVVLFPLDGSTNGSSTTEVVCVFDRPMDPPADLDAGWDVQVRPVGGMDAPPTFDPDPAPLVVADFLGVPLEDRRLWTWRSTNGGDPQRLTTSGGRVTVSVSPASDAFVAVGDPTQTSSAASTTFTLSSAPRPRSALLNPAIEPQDAIGIANLDGADPTLDVALQVDFEPDDLAQDGDVLTVFFFGEDPADDSNTLAFQRSTTLSGMGGIATATFTRAQLNLTSNTAPLNVRVADGDVRFAVRLERGSDQGYLRLLDVDLVADDVQDPVLDTLAPSLVRLTTQLLETDPIAVDTPDLVVAGFGDVGIGDFVRGAEVESTTGMGATNVATMGVVPEVLGSSPTVILDGGDPLIVSGFLASPTPVGRLEPGSGPLDVEVTIFDRALNRAAQTLTVQARQRGNVGNVPLDPTDPAPLTVEVYDAVTLLPLPGASVYSHAETDLGGGMSSFTSLGAAQVTDLDGLTTMVPHHAPPDVATLVTVELTGYDVVTFHGVPTMALSIPLSPTARVPATESSSVVTQPDLGSFVRRVGDTRRSADLFPTVPTADSPGTNEFDFSVGGLRTGRLGAQTFLAGIVDAQESDVSKDRLVKAFQLRLPVPPLFLPANMGMAAFTITGLLDDPGGSSADLAQAVADVQLDASGVTGLDPTSLLADDDYGMQPLVSVEGTIPGVDRPVPVGLGTAYDTATADLYDLRSAFAGAAEPTNGALAEVFEADLHLRAELREEDPTTMALGSVSGLRPTLAALAGLDPLLPPDVPAVTSIATDGTGSVTAPGFGFTFTDTIDDASGLLVDGRGIYRITLTEDLGGGATGRRWELYKLDEAGATDVRVHFPDLAPDPVPLTTGAGATTRLAISSFAWEAFPVFDALDMEADSFLWSELGRETEIYAHAAAFLFTLL